MNILVINCGSSSLKYQLINSASEAVLAKGLCERIGIEGSQITYQPAGGEKEVTVSPMPTHTQAIQMVLDALTNDKTVSYTHLQYGLYIVSNCQSGYIEVLLESCGLREYVRDIECYGNTGLPKGDNIRMVVQRNHLERCFYVGDTHMDEEAAGAAGIPFVHAAYGFGRAERPVGTIESLSQLTALAKKLLD